MPSCWRHVGKRSVDIKRGRKVKVETDCKETNNGGMIVQKSDNQPL